MTTWLRYQRYALAAGAAAVLLLAAAIVLAAPWYSWLLVAPVVVKLGAFAIRISAAHGRKVRAAHVARVRLAQGRFRPEQVRSHCADPCFRVIAAEALARAGVPRRERRRLIREFAAECRARASSFVVIDHRTGTVRTFDGAARPFAT